MHAHKCMHWIEVVAAMSLLCYLKPVDVLPGSRGELSAQISSQLIAEANKEVQQALNDAMTPKQRGSYTKYTPSQRAEINYE